jgi:hypothetical protein
VFSSRVGGGVSALEDRAWRRQGCRRCNINTRERHCLSNQSPPAKDAGVHLPLRHPNPTILACREMTSRQCPATGSIAHLPQAVELQDHEGTAISFKLAAPRLQAICSLSSQTLPLLATIASLRISFADFYTSAICPPGQHSSGLSFAASTPQADSLKQSPCRSSPLNFTRAGL